MKSNENSSTQPNDSSSETPEGKNYTPEAVKACGIEAMMNGEECEACQ